MQVTCPGCNSRFLLPDGVKDGARLRCSVCKKVFTFEAPREKAQSEEQVQPAPAGKEEKEAPLSFTSSAKMPRESNLPELSAPKKRSSGILWIMLIMLFALAFSIAWKTLPEFRAQVEGLQERVLGIQKPAAPAVDTATAPAEFDKLILQDVRQYFVKNDKIGRLLVVDGVVVNKDTVARRNIHVEAALIGKDRKTIDTRLQKAGVRLSNTQLEVMTEAEMLAALANEKEIALTNASVQPQGTVPFTVVFFNPSKEVSEYAVKVGESEVVEGAAPALQQGAAAPASAPAPTQAQGTAAPVPAQTPAPAPVQAPAQK